MSCAVSGGNYGDLHVLAFCRVCPVGTYMDRVWSAGSCVACPAGTYAPVAGGTNTSACLACPVDATSKAGSANAVDCICNIGFKGFDGAACSACSVGFYTAANGSGSCLWCHAGTYLNTTGSSVCYWCPANSHLLVESDAIVDCICNIRFNG
eukprot:2778667-Rhodomonas_salina.2